MKKIQQINQYLLERYPTIWNTRLLWMLLTGFILHIIFFIVGYISHSDPRSLQFNAIRQDYYKHGVFAFQVIISVLILVAWLIFMFKNNAFKNFYPTSKAKLFSQFCHYFIIIFINTTFYFSYMAGFKLFINKAYPEEEFVKNIKLINKASAFLTYDYNYYTLDNRRTPPFNQYYCETRLEDIDPTKKYFVYYNEVYQFYDLYQKTVTAKDQYGDFLEPAREKKLNIDYVYMTTDGKSRTYFYKNNVVDVSQYVKSSQLSYYNFSHVFYSRESGIDDPYGYQPVNVIRSQGSESIVNTQVTQILNQKNPKIIENLLSEFLEISKKYKIENNLDAKRWTDLVFHPEDFNVHRFIRDSDPQKDILDRERIAYTDERAVESDTYVEMVDNAAVAKDDAVILDNNGQIVKDSIQIKSYNPEIDKQQSPSDFASKNKSSFYYYNQDLKYLLQSVDSIKTFNYFEGVIHIYIWLSFALSLIVFSFRMMGLKTFIFSAITAGILVLAVVFSTLLIHHTTHLKEDFIACYISFFLMSFVLLISLFYLKYGSKLIMSIFVTLSLNSFVGLIMIILMLIHLHQMQYINEHKLNGKMETVLDILDIYLSYILLIVGFGFVYFYSGIIQKWKARPE